MAQPASMVVQVTLETHEARRQVRRLRKDIRETDIALARLEVGLDTHLSDLAEKLRALGIRLEVG